MLMLEVKPMLGFDVDLIFKSISESNSNPSLEYNQNLMSI